MGQTRWVWAGAAGLALLAAACGGGQSADTDNKSMARGSEQIAPASGNAEGGQSGLTAALSPDRKLIFNVHLDLVMKDVQSGFERIGQIAEANGGLVADSNMRFENGQRRATITVRVPANRYADVLAQIRGTAAKVESERANANDVTEEYTDLQARQRNLEASEQQLLVLLGQARNVQEVLQVQDRITSTRAEIEKIKGRLNLLTRLTDLATIQAQLRPEPEPVAKATDRSPLEALRSGWEASLAVMGAVALLALTIAAFSWWLLPLAAAALWLLRRELRRRAGMEQVPVEPAA